MSYAEAPDHPDLKWMHTLEQQQQGLGALGMDYYSRRKAAGLWAQKGLLGKRAVAKKLALRRMVSSRRRDLLRRKYYSRIAPPRPIRIPSPRSPVPGISPNAVVAVADLERKRAAVLKGRIRKIAQLAAAQSNLAKRLKKVPGLTQARLYGRRPVNLPQPTWNYLSTQGIITPGGMITPMGSYVEAGPSEAFGGFGVTPVFANMQALQAAQAAQAAQETAAFSLRAGANVTPAQFITPAFRGASLRQQVASSAAQAAVIAKDCSYYTARAAALERESSANCNWADLACHARKAAAQAAREIANKVCAEEAAARAKANAAMAAKRVIKPTLYKAPPAVPTLKVALPRPTRITTKLPDNRLITTAGGTIVAEAGEPPGIVLSPAGGPPEINLPGGDIQPAWVPPVKEERSKVPLYLGLALIAGGVFYVAQRKKA